MCNCDGIINDNYLHCCTLFSTSGRVHVPRVKHGSGSVMIWAAILWYSMRPWLLCLVALLPSIMIVTILTDLDYPTVQCLFPNRSVIFQERGALFTQLASFRTGFVSMRMNCCTSLATTVTRSRYYWVFVVLFGETHTWSQSTFIIVIWTCHYFACRTV